MAGRAGGDSVEEGRAEGGEVTGREKGTQERIGWRRRNAVEMAAGSFGAGGFADGLSVLPLPLDPGCEASSIRCDSGRFLQVHYHIGCAINLHSIINSGLIPGGQNLSKRQTVFFLPVDPMDKEHKDPDTIDPGAPCLARHMRKVWKKHQNTVFRVDVKLAQNNGLKFYQTRSNAIILHETLQRKLFGWKLEKSYMRRYMRHLDLLQRFP